MKKIIFFVFAIIIALNSKAQLSNDDCVNAIPITIDANGTACVTGTTVNAIPTNFTGHACWPTLQDIPEVWYTYIVTGDQNVITVTPNGGTPAQQVAVSLTNQPCGSGALSTCALAATNGGTATANYIYAVGTQVWINVGSIVAEGGFQLCISSTTPPAAPGGTCATATVLCDKNPFSLNTFPGNVTALQPSCFGNSFQDPVFYQFTCGQSGTCEWTADPQGNNTELDWVMYDITTGCPNNSTPELACNFFYAGDNGSPAGMSSTVATATCPITNGAGPATFEYCTPANLVAGRKYLIIIDNYSAISGENDGFNMSFGGTFTIAPTSQFTATPLTSCAPPANVTFNNTSTTAVSYNWNFGNGNTSTAASPAGQTYTTPGVYLVSLAATSNTGCVDISTQTITIGTPPVVTVPTNTTVCAGATIPAAVFTTVPTGATFTWTNSNTAIGLAATGNANIDAFTATNTTSAPITATITVTPTLNGCVGAAASYTITVDPSPTLTAVTSQTVCANANTTAITYAVAPATSTIAWTNSNTAIGIGASGNGDISSFTATNTGSTAISGNFVATPTFNGCNGTPRTFTITVNPIPSLTAITSQTVCANANTTAINFSSTPAGATINWINSNSAIGIGTTGTGNIAAFAGTNTGSTQISGNFAATPTLNNCTGTAQNFTISVNPTPTLAAITSQTVCANANTTAINFNPTPATATVNWTNSNGTIGIGTTGTGNIAAFTGANTGSTAAIGNFAATPTENGCTGTAQNFTITVNPIPVLTAIASQTVCPSANTSAINFVSNPVGATVDWTNSNSNIGIGTSGTGNIAAFAGTNTGSSAISGNFAATPTLNTCVGTAQNFTITVNPLPVLTAVTSQTICPGSNTSAINFTSNPAGATVSWTNSNTNIGIGASGNGNIAPFTGTNAGLTSLTGNFIATPTLNTCVGPTLTFDITVSPLPTATIGSNSPVCVNATLNLTSGGGTIYSWQGPDNFTSNSQNPSLANASLPMAGTYTVTVGVGGTCQSTATVAVVVNPLPVVTISSNSPVCENGTINLTASGGVSYSWSGPPPNSFSSNTQNPSLSPATLDMAVNYTVTVTDANGCVNANVTTVVVNPLPQAPITNPVTYCQNDVATVLTATNSSNSTLNWYGTNATGGTASSSAPTPSTANAGTTTYYVSQTANNCEGPRASLNVSVNPLPNATLNAVTGGCAPICRDFTVTSTSNLVSYTWDMGNGIANTTSPNLTHCYNDGGTYSIEITVTDDLGCVKAFPFPNWINVFENPTANFIYNPMPVTILEPTVTFTDNSIGSNIMSYNWNFGDPLSSTASGQNVVFTYLTTGIYNVELAIMTINGCVDTIYKPVEVLEDFSVYIPNAFSPNGDGINEEFYPIGNGISDDKYSFMIFDRWGELIFSSNKLENKWDGKRMGRSEIVQQDTYIYKLSCRSFKGDKFSKSGHVNVIR